MASRSIARALVLTAVVLPLQAVPGQAQTARTFVSANGSDANVCSRSAPCRTFQAAHDKTTAGGEINVLDPGGYGSLLISKSISVVNDGAGSAGILVPSGMTGITINAGSSGIVNLRGLIIEGAGVGQVGIRFNNGKSLTIQDSVVRNVAGNGIEFFPTVNSHLAASNTYLSDNFGSGILVNPVGSGLTVTSVVSHVEAHNNGFGVGVFGRSSTGTVKMAVTDSVMSKNVNTGITSDSGPGFSIASVTVKNSVSVHNLTGVYANSAQASMRIGQSSISDNGNGWKVENGGTIQSYGDNYIDGNAALDTAPPSIPRK
ncbi:MAG: hypothetical protein QOI12_4830 [Alphaproteobacteria bacterium]|jgi:hypothetical protein|nr:hypothetical protein [Alphaproteobacteria bacterium]